MPLASARASDFWDSVRTPGLGAARAAIAAGLDALGRNRAREALERADVATSACPRCAEAHTLRGRALAALGRNGDALGAFERARELAPEALLEPATARLAATSALVVGRADIAIAVLGAAHLGGDPAARDRGELILADAHQASGAAGLPHARALYGAASNRAELAPAVTLGLALALHRSGEIEAALAMARRLQTSEAESATRWPWLPLSERAARIALWLTAVGDLVGAQARWRDASQGGGPFTEHARRELERLALPSRRP